MILFLDDLFKFLKFSDEIKLSITYCIHVYCVFKMVVLQDKISKFSGTRLRIIIALARALCRRALFMFLIHQCLATHWNSLFWSLLELAPLAAFALFSLWWLDDVGLAAPKSRAYVCQESSPIGWFSSHKSWMKWYKSSDTPT